MDHEKNGEQINYQTTRESTLLQWQIRWASTARGLWILNDIPDVVAWTQKKHDTTIIRSLVFSEVLTPNG